MANLYWELRKAMGRQSLRCGSVMIPRRMRTWKRTPMRKYQVFYPCNRWGVGWHRNGRKANKHTTQ